MLVSTGTKVNSTHPVEFDLCRGCGVFCSSTTGAVGTGEVMSTSAGGAALVSTAGASTSGSAPLRLSFFFSRCFRFSSSAACMSAKLFIFITWDVLRREWLELNDGLLLVLAVTKKNLKRNNKHKHHYLVFIWHAKFSVLECNDRAKSIRRRDKQHTAIMWPIISHDRTLKCAEYAKYANIPHEMITTTYHERSLRLE